MALVIGSVNADAGMSQEIFQVIDAQLSPPLQTAVDKAQEVQAKEEAQKALNGAREGWKKLSFAIASGVINHITANMEVFGITVQGDVTTTVKVNTEGADPGNHQHSVNVLGEAKNVEFTQSDDRPGRVK